MSRLEAKNISKTLDNKKVLSDISFYINSGEIVAILGPNGAGKTTCFSMLIGLTKPDNGNILLDELDISNFAIHQRSQKGLGYLPQESSVFKSLNVEENIMLVLEICSQKSNENEAKLNELLDEFGISHLRKTTAGLLSGGERRRLEIARTMAIKPRFILLDEPFAGIDPITISEIKKIILYLKKSNIGILITDHNVKETLDIVDRSYIIYDGRVISSGSASEILKSEEVKSVYLGQEFKMQ